MLTNLRRNQPELFSRIHQGQDWHEEADTQARIAAKEIVSLVSSGSIGYDCDAKLITGNVGYVVAKNP